jgi:hypothetical protein
MPVVDEQAREARKPHRGARWALVTIFVPVIVLIVLVVVPMIRPVSFAVGRDKYTISSHYGVRTSLLRSDDPLTLDFASPSGPQGFIEFSDASFGGTTWQLRLGNWFYRVQRVSEIAR